MPDETTDQENRKKIIIAVIYTTPVDMEDLFAIIFDADACIEPLVEQQAMHQSLLGPSLCNLILEFGFFQGHSDLDFDILTMLAGIADLLATRRIILASQSPRRRELLSDCNLVFDVLPSKFEENLSKDQFASPDEYVIATAKGKALDVFHASDATEKPTIVVACDTVVVNDNKIMEKPEDEEDAFQTILGLSNKTHEVYSGVVIMSTTMGPNDPHVFFEKTIVTFGDLHPSDIKAYIATGEPMDKAGSYGLQGKARCFASSVHGCHNNIVGFPLQRFCTEMRKLAEQKQL